MANAATHDGVLQDTKYMPLSQTWRWSGQTNRIDLCFVESRMQQRLDSQSRLWEMTSKAGHRPVSPILSRTALGPLSNPADTPNSKRPTTNLGPTNCARSCTEVALCQACKALHLFKSDGEKLYTGFTETTHLYQ